jgi:beta-lactamase class D
MARCTQASGAAMRALILGILAPLACARPTTAPPPAAATTETPAPAPPPIDHPGCFMISRKDGTETRVVNPTECAVATTPASTFKLPHALIALQLQVVTDLDTIKRWDGVKRWNPAWDADHTLRSALRESVVWYFQQTATDIGLQRMNAWLEQLDYGEGGAAEPLTKFWLDGGSLEITGPEQLAFLQRMFDHRLPIDARHIDAVSEAIAGPIEDWRRRLPAGTEPPRSRATLHAKTGTDTTRLDDDTTGAVTWWVGEVEGPAGTWVFVSRVRAPGEPGTESPAVAAGMRALAQAGAL